MMAQSANPSPSPTPSPTNGTPSGASAQAAANGRTEFLDLADTAARQNAEKIEAKRQEHERMRERQRRLFEEQMRALELEHQREEAELLKGAVSAPASPPPSSKANAARRHSGDGASIGATDQDGAGKLAGALGRLSLAPGEGVPRTRTASPSTAANASKIAPPGVSFSFDDELEGDDRYNSVKYLQMNSDDDKFPILVRREDFPGQLSAGSAALDLALAAAQAGTTTSRLGSVLKARASAGDWPSARSGSASPARVPSPSATVAANKRHSSVSVPPSASPPPSGAKSVSHSPVADKSAATVAALSGGRRTTGYNTPVPDLGGFPRGVSSPYPELDTFASLANIDTNPPYPLTGPNPTPSASAGAGGPRSSTGGGPGSSYAEDYKFGWELNGLGGFGRGMGGVMGKAGRRADLELNRFAGTRLEDLKGEIYSLCKDQHGCRYLQKKLEENEDGHRDMIFNETFPHFAELMTADPFGNYLCQKLLEYANDGQRDAICESVAPELVTISLNMHGTRAVQKLIDHLSTRRQIHAIIVALSMHVVTLIKDLNGNHVIQKCLNRLVPEDNQFIYNAVAQHCVEVATHRHGCCVLQRCVDHASDAQRIQLVAEITYHALSLVQDPFGNYVVQYVLDLGDARFTDAVIRQFIGHICVLSVQKFSSNVVEKCIRVAEPTTRHMLIDELLNRSRLEKLLRDAFANYVVQTALDYAEPSQRMLLVECIRPILPMIRNTPYGKRIQSKLQRESEAYNRHSYGGGYPHALMSLGLGAQQAHRAGGSGGGGRGHLSHGAGSLVGLGGDPYASPFLSSAAAGFHPSLASHHAAHHAHHLSVHHAPPPPPHLPADPIYSQGAIRQPPPPSFADSYGLAAAAAGSAAGLYSAAGGLGGVGAGAFGLGAAGAHDGAYSAQHSPYPSYL